MAVRPDASARHARPDRSQVKCSRFEPEEEGSSEAAIDISAFDEAAVLDEEFLKAAVSDFQHVVQGATNDKNKLIGMLEGTMSEYRRQVRMDPPPPVRLSRSPANGDKRVASRTPQALPWMPARASEAVVLWSRAEPRAATVAPRVPQIKEMQAELETAMQQKASQTSAVELNTPGGVKLVIAGMRREVDSLTRQTSVLDEKFIALKKKRRAESAYAKKFMKQTQDNIRSVESRVSARMADSMCMTKASLIRRCTRPNHRRQCLVGTYQCLSLPRPLCIRPDPPPARWRSTT